jgi:hypothetical protein
MEILRTLSDFFNHPFFCIFGGISTCLVILGFVVTGFLFIRGIFPVWYRLGMGLSKRKIALFASSGFDSLQNMLIDSGIFKNKNILQINKDSIKKAENETLFLLYWKDFHDNIEEVLSIKKDSTVLIVYAPASEERIETSTMEKINSHRNAIVVNFRGRLLNDILISMITTSYEKR